MAQDNSSSSVAQNHQKVGHHCFKATCSLLKHFHISKIVALPKLKTLVIVEACSGLQNWTKALRKSWSTLELQSECYGSSNNTLQAGRSSQGLLRDYSLNSTVSFQNTSRDLDAKEEGRSQNYHSFHFSRSLEEKEMKEKRVHKETPPSSCEGHASSSLPRSHREASLEEVFIYSHCHLHMPYSKLSFKGTF